MVEPAPVAAGIGASAVADAAPPAPPPVRVHRKLATGSVPGSATRTTFTLSIDGSRAELIEIDEAAYDVKSIADADQVQAWRRVGMRAYRGTARGDGSAQVLELATADQQPLAMRCVAIEVTAAPPGARRVASPTRRRTGCDPGVWAPPATATIDALACGEGSTEAGPGDDDDDRLVFGDSVGIEYAFENDGCALRGGGLREMDH